MVCLIPVANVSAENVSLTLDKNVPYVDTPFLCEDMLPGDTAVKNYKLNIYHNEKVRVTFSINIDEDLYKLSEHVFLTIEDWNFTR